MKNYDDLTNRLLERRDRYVATQQKKRKMMLRASASVGCVAVVALAGVGLVHSGVFDQTPPVTDAVVKTTTVTTAPTEQESTTTAAATETTTVTTITTIAPTQTETTYPQTQASNKGSHYRPTTRPTQTVSTTSASKTTQTTQTTPSTQPTVSQTKPTATQTKPTATQTKPTQTTPTTQPTVPPVEDDYIVVETPVGSEPGNPYMISAKIPAQCSAADEFVPISLSYGVGENTFAEGPAHVVLYYYDGKNESIFKRIERQDFITDYVVQYVWDEDRMWIVDYIYSHTETILFPLSLCSEDSGRIWIVLADGTSDEKDGILTDGYLFCVSSVCFDYVRSGTNITFRIVA